MSTKPIKRYSKNLLIGKCKLKHDAISYNIWIISTAPELPLPWSAVFLSLHSIFISLFLHLHETVCSISSYFYLTPTADDLACYFEAADRNAHTFLPALPRSPHLSLYLCIPSLKTNLSTCT